MANDGDFLIAAVGGFCLGVYSFFNGFKLLKQKRLIENTPTSKIRSLAMGLVEIYGEVMPVKGQLLKSPLTNKDCVYYSYSIEEHRSSGKRSKWVLVKSGSENALFFIKDDTGIVLVNPKDAYIDIPPDFKFDSGFGKDPPVSTKQFLKTNNLSFEGFLGINKKMRYTERYIAPRDNLYTMGTAGDNPLVEEATAAKNEADIMIQKGRNKIYYISDRHEKDILKSFKWKTIAGIYGGGALSVACLAVIFLYLRIF